MVTAEWDLSSIKFIGIDEDAILHITSTPSIANFVTIDASGAVRTHGDGKTPETIVYNSEVFGWPAHFKFSAEGYKTYEFNNIDKGDIHSWESNLHVILEPEEVLEYPKDITRDPYTFTASNAEEEKQFKEFLGIYPPGDDLDTWLSKRDLAGLEQWKDYWFNIFGGLGRSDVLTFIDYKFQEYKNLLEPELTWWEKLLAFIFAPDLLLYLVNKELFATGYKLLTDNDLTDAEYIRIQAEIADLILPINLMLILTEGKNLKGEAVDFSDTEAHLELAALALMLTPFRFIGKIGSKIGLKIGGKGVLDIAGKLGLKKATPEVIEAMLKSDNYKWIFEAARKDPGSWARLAPKLSKEAQAIISAGLQGAHPTAAYRLFEEAVLLAERSKVPITTATWTWLTTHKGTTLMTTLASIWGVMGFEAFTNWPLADNIGFLEYANSNAVKEAYEAGTITKEKALETIDKIITILQAAHDKIEVSTNWNPLMMAFGSGILLTAKENLALAERIRDEIEAIIPLEPTGTLIIRPIPTDAKVSVVGQIPSTGIFSEELQVGTYDYVVSKFGYVSKSGVLEVIAETTTGANVELELEPEPVEEELPPEEVVGRLKIDAIDELGSSEEIVIEVAGHPEITTTGIYELSPGSYDVKATKEGFVTQTKTGFVSEIKDGAVSFILKKVEEVIPVPVKATITISSIPIEADVYIDGEYTFTKTPYTVLLDAGIYIIRVQKEGFYPEEVIAEIEEGETAEIPFTLQEILAPEIPTEPYIPYQPVYTPGYENLYPAYYSIPSYEAPAPVPEKELLLNIETTDLYPWNGRIYSIAIQDLSIPGSLPIILIDNDEETLILQFLDLFNQLNPEKLIGFKLTFDHRFIFTKMMLYRIQNKAFKNIEMHDVKQIMDQVQEAFVYFPSKVGTLDDWGKMLLGIGKLGSQELMLRKYIAGDFDYVKAFQLRQMEITNGLYQLSRFSGSESLSSPIQSIPSQISPEYPVSIPIGSEIQGQKQCLNCLAYNPIDAKTCIVCGWEF